MYELTAFCLPNYQLSKTQHIGKLVPSSKFSGVSSKIQKVSISDIGSLFCHNGNTGSIFQISKCQHFGLWAFGFHIPIYQHFESAMEEIQTDHTNASIYQYTKYSHMQSIWSFGLYQSYVGILVLTKQPNGLLILSLKNLINWWYRPFFIKS